MIYIILCTISLSVSLIFQYNQIVLMNNTKYLS